ncbi:sugar ABC transporter substrate-binding protein [Burkholderia pyrrocinia]|uniref:Sugar ABC transporter substrate-binding protein n=1 Tax=Burkholderia pyrrocinia TaxID=60550 RepID=A0A2Z5NAH2_BURPY|nr:sugar ABC transporter substrate-binding protein [Burkholderia pyrrocinia]AXF25878.1 sugar ABC transporter substrate-binding protein [Burkholderia pyrrocinia]
MDTNHKPERQLERRRTATCIVAVCAAAIGIFHGANALAASETIAAFYKNQVDPHFALVHAGVDAEAKLLGVSVTHYAPTRPNDLGEQLSELEDVGVKKPSAVLFMGVNPHGVVPAIQKINAIGIPVVNYNDRVAGGKFSSVVVADDYNLGLDVARYLFKSLGGKGNVVILEGVKGSTTSDERERGFKKALQEFPNIHLLASQPANYQRLQALQVMENLIQSNPKIDGVLAAADVMAMGAIEALEAAGQKQVKVVGIGGVPESIKAIKEGRLLATAEFNGFKMGCIATMAAVRTLRKEPVPDTVLIKGIVIDKTNYAPFELPGDQRQCPAWNDVASK